jgi:hypothetical protein
MGGRRGGRSGRKRSSWGNGTEENDGEEVTGVEGCLEGSFHPSIPVPIGISAYGWKDGGIFGKFLSIGENAVTPYSKRSHFRVKTLLLLSQNDNRFGADR